MNTEYLYCFSCMCPIDAVDAVCPHCGHDNHVRSNGPGYLPQTVLMNQYLVGMKKGHGGFGVTYIGIDLTLERRVAIKEYFPREMATRDGASHSLQSYSNSEDDFARGRRRALAEGRTVASITPQPNIVQIHSAFEANNTIYIVMEYIDGETLAQLVAHRNAPLSWEEVRRYFFPLISALAQVHRSGIIHRDVSPDNIMIRRSDDCAVLLDFGAAYTAAANGMTEHTTRSVIIRPSYTPLEQRSPNSVLDARTDEHAMCATMYFALTGKAPTDALMRALGEEVPTPRSLGSDIPVSMEAVLLRGMSLNTADRYDDLEQLTQAFSGKRVEPSFPSSSAPKKTRKTNPLIIGGAAAAGALALSMLAAALIPDGSTPQPETSATPLVSPAEELAAIAPAPTTATPAPTTATPAPTTATPAPTTATPAPTTATPAPTTATPAPTTATPSPTTATPAPTTATPAPTTATPAPTTATPAPTTATPAPTTATPAPTTATPAPTTATPAPTTATPAPTTATPAPTTATPAPTTATPAPTTATPAPTTATPAPTTATPAPTTATPAPTTATPAPTTATPAPTTATPAPTTATPAPTTATPAPTTATPAPTTATPAPTTATPAPTTATPAPTTATPAPTTATPAPTTATPAPTTATPAPTTATPAPTTATPAPTTATPAPTTATPAPTTATPAPTTATPSPTTATPAPTTATPAPTTATPAPTTATPAPTTATPAPTTATPAPTTATPAPTTATPAPTTATPAPTTATPAPTTATPAPTTATPAPTTATPAPTTATPAPTTATPAPTTATPAPTTATPAPTTATPAPTTATPAPTTATPAPTTATPAPTTATPAPPTPTPFPTSIAEDYYVIHPNENGTCIITRFNDETAATLDIPAKIKGYTVTAIGEYAFGGLANLTTVTVPDSVASIADNAFSGCTNVVLIAKPGSDAEEAISEANLPTPTPVPTPTPTPTPCPTLKPASTAAKNITTGDYTILAYEDGTCTITSYNGTKSKLEIPQKLAGYRVTDIGYIAFAYNESIISVTIPEGVTSIGNSAFVGCSNLKSVSLPEGLVSIGQYSFDSCYALASINLPGTLTSIGDSAFSDCNSLNSVTLPNELKWIGDYTFTDCGALTSLKLSSKLEYLDRNAFTFGGYSTTNHPTSIVMPNSVKAIDSHAIRVMDPKKTINITLPAGIQYISADAFYFFHSSDKLTFSVPYGTYAFDYVYYGGFAYTVTDKPSNVQIPTEDGKKFTVNGITAQSYSDGTCRITGLTHYGSKLIIPERLGEYTVTGIDTYAFYECSFKSVILPKTLKYIGPYAFTRCTALTSIELPDSITFMGRSVFYDCEALEHVKLPANLTALPDCTFYKCTNLVRVDWPETLVAIGHDAFACSGIKEVKIPDSVSLIASCAFTSCENLEQVQFPANLKYIGSYAFSDSKKLDEVILPDGIRYVGGHAFSECGLIDVVLPGSIEFIGASSFGYTPDSKADFTVVEGSYAHQYLQEEGFTRLYSYDTLQPTPTPVPTTPTPAPAATPTPTIPPIPATNVTPTPTPAVSTTSKVIDSYTVRIFADGTCETISYNKTPPTNLIIPAKLGSNSVIAIGEGVYQGMNMRSANIKDGVQHLGKRAFAGCGSLSEVTLPGTLLTIGDEAFADCGDLTSITLPKGLTTIGSAAFSGSGLTQVSIPEGVTSIGENAFCNTQLTSLHIPASVTQAGQVICDDRVKLTIDPANPVYRVENNRLVPIAPPATPTPAPTSTPSQHIVSSAAQPLADHALPGHADVEDAYMLPDDAPEMLSLSVAAAGDAYILSGKVKDVHTAVTMTVTCGYESPVSYTGVSGSFSLTLAGYTPGTALQVTLSATLPDERSATTTYDLSSCTDMKDTPSLCTIIHGLTIYNYKDGLLDTLSVVFPMDDMDVTAIYDRYGSLTSYTYVRDGGIYTLDVNGQFLRVHVAANGQSYTFTRENGWAVFNSEWLEFLLCEAPTDFDLTAVPALTITQEEFIP